MERWRIVFLSDDIGLIFGVKKENAGIRKNEYWHYPCYSAQLLGINNAIYRAD